MKRFYLDKIKANLWRDTNKGIPPKRAKKRLAQWKKEQKKYGFDSRDTWNLDYTMVAILYERLKMYVEITFVDMEKTLVPHERPDFWNSSEKPTKEEIKNFKENAEFDKLDVLIDELILLCEKYLKEEYSLDKGYEVTDEIWAKWARISPFVWW